MMFDVYLFTGGFDPLHSGHLSVIKSLPGNLVIGLNSDEWLTRKKGKPFLNIRERREIMSSLSGVISVIEFDDSDNSACDAIEVCLSRFKKSRIVFVNGGDREQTNTPEYKEYKNHPLVSFKFGVGGSNKLNSSSKILYDWGGYKEQRKWGRFITYNYNDGVKLKRLEISPGEFISMQKHQDRNEFWLIESGSGIVKYGFSTDSLIHRNVAKHDQIVIEKGMWHQIINDKDGPLRIVEIQYGSRCEESDIIRL